MTFSSIASGEQFNHAEKTPLKRLGREISHLEFQFIFAAGRFSVPGCLVKSSPSVFLYSFAKVVSASTTAGCWAKLKVSPGSVERSYRASGTGTDL